MNYAQQNFRFIRDCTGLSKIAFGKLFKPIITRGMIDGYESQKSKIPVDVLLQVGDHFGLTLDDLTNKDLSVNPGIVVFKNYSKDLSEKRMVDMLKQKDTYIEELKRKIEMLEDQNKTLASKLAKKIA